MGKCWRTVWKKRFLVWGRGDVGGSVGGDVRKSIGVWGR